MSENELHMHSKELLGFFSLLIFPCILSMTNNMMQEVYLDVFDQKYFVRLLMYYLFDLFNVILRRPVGRKVQDVMNIQSEKRKAAKAFLIMARYSRDTDLLIKQFLPDLYVTHSKISIKSQR